MFNFITALELLYILNWKILLRIGNYNNQHSRDWLDLYTGIYLCRIFLYSMILLKTPILRGVMVAQCAVNALA